MTTLIQISSGPANKLSEGIPLAHPSLSHPQPKAELLGRACKIPEAHITNFSEEAIRSQPAFMLSQLLRHLKPCLREAAGLGGWEVVSAGHGVSVGATTGIMLTLPSLDVVQGHRFDAPHVIFSDTLSGNEDIPANVSAVLTSSSIDVLAHVAIRARDQGVFLATCSDSAPAGATRKYAGFSGKVVAVSTDAAGEVGITTRGTRPTLIFQVSLGFVSKLLPPPRPFVCTLFFL